MAFTTSVGIEARCRKKYWQREWKGVPAVLKSKGSTLIGLLISIAIVAIFAALTAILAVSCFRLN
jgi:hypothetical protein